ncbi:MAG TPA: aldo/keto reductase, partial [Bryobacteraceae bacterium]|nr:aldo/keto reductase [Bryobacteraceae bacterium]
MQNRQLGNSNIEITPLGLGAWAIGGADWAFTWGPQDDNDSIRSLQEGLDAGLNWIDTAAVY